MQIRDLRLTAKLPDGSPIEIKKEFEVDGLQGVAKQVEMPCVSSGLLDDVHQNRPQVHRSLPERRHRSGLTEQSEPRDRTTTARAPSLWEPRKAAQ